ncbi:unnamed protein product, partial [Amoebophrya sp. A25]|eukprot:GSA25T00023844001.1
MLDAQISASRRGFQNTMSRLFRKPREQIAASSDNLALVGGGEVASTTSSVKQVTFNTGPGSGGGGKIH